MQEGGYKSITAAIIVLTGASAWVVSFMRPEIVDAFRLFYFFSGAAVLIGGLYWIRPTRDFAVVLSRLVVGSLFIVSGLIKCNDPMGFSFKLEEYFDERSLGTFWAFFYDYSLIIAFVMAILESALGYAVITGLQFRITAWILLALTIFFGWLTFYTASCNEMQAVAMQKGIPFEKICVTDCGCFGDALKGSIGRSLTPWESFYKDLFLMVFVVILFLERNKIKTNTDQQNIVYSLLTWGLVTLLSVGLFSWWFPSLVTIFLLLVLFILLNKKQMVWASILVFMLPAGISLYAYNFLPLKDFRPYAIGKNIYEQMQLPLNAQPDVYETILTYKNKVTGEIKDFDQNNYPWQDSNWVWVNTQTRLVKEGDKPAITDFSIMDKDGNDVTLDYLQDDEPVVFIIAYNLAKSSERGWKKVAGMVKQLQESGIYVIALSASPQEEIEKITKKYQLNIDFYACDETTLKTVIRANPGVMLLRKGLVLGKWHYHNLPEAEKIKKIINGR